MNPVAHVARRRKSSAKKDDNPNSLFYETIAHFYDRLYEEIDAPEAVRQWLILIKEFAEPSTLKEKSIPKMLDLGCGTGRYLQAWVEAGFSVTGVDISKKMLQRAELRKVACSIPDRVHLVCHDARLHSSELQEEAPFAIAVAHFNFLNLFSLEEVRGILRELRPYFTRGSRFFTDCAPPSLIPPLGHEEYSLGKRLKIDLTTNPDVGNRTVSQVYRYGAGEFREKFWFHTAKELAGVAQASGWALEAKYAWRPELASNPWTKKQGGQSHRVCVFKTR